MGLYSNDADLNDIDMNALVEAFLIDDLTHNYGEDTIKEFCAPGGAADALLEARVFSNANTVSRLSKKDDFTRRYVIAAIQLAKAHKDPLYAKLVKYNLFRKQVRKKIVDKYGAKAKKAATMGQRQYVKAMRGVNLTNSITQAGSANSITNDSNR